MDDPDAPAGTWVHWVLYNLPVNVTELPEGVERQEQLANRALQGRNDFRRIGYGGPCPPGGKAHRYFFKLYALDTKLSLKAGATIDICIKNAIQSLGVQEQNTYAQTEGEC